MSKVTWSESRITALQKEGRGAGEGAQYRPWLEIAEISSKGVSHRTHSPKTQRIHHLLSDVELGFFRMLEWSRDVIDIREQFPLSRQVTKQLAAELRIKHPFYPGTTVETVMTIDFLVTRRYSGGTVLEAYDTKRSDGVEDARTIEKLEIVRTACEQNGVPHHLICHGELPHQKIKQLNWIATGLVMPNEMEPTVGFFDDFSGRMLEDLLRANKQLRLTDYCASIDARWLLKEGTGLRLAKILMFRRELMPDLNQQDLVVAPVGSFTVTAREGELRAIGDWK